MKLRCKQVKCEDPVPLTSTTMPSCRGPLVLRFSFSPSMEYSHCKPFSMKVFDSASSLFAFSKKFPVTWFFTAVSNEKKKKEAFYACVVGKNVCKSCSFQLHSLKISEILDQPSPAKQLGDFPWSRERVRMYFEMFGAVVSQQLFFPSCVSSLLPMS